MLFLFHGTCLRLPQLIRKGKYEGVEYFLLPCPVMEFLEKWSKSSMRSLYTQKCLLPTIKMRLLKYKTEKDLQMNYLLRTWSFAPNTDYPNALFCNDTCKAQKGEKRLLYFYSIFQLKCSPDITQNGGIKSWILEFIVCVSSLLQETSNVLCLLSNIQVLEKV